MRVVRTRAAVVVLAEIAIEAKHLVAVLRKACFLEISIERLFYGLTMLGAVIGDVIDGQE